MYRYSCTSTRTSKYKYPDTGILIAFPCGHGSTVTFRWTDPMDSRCLGTGTNLNGGRVGCFEPSTKWGVLRLSLAYKAKWHSKDFTG